jgi:hypothetical protein
MSRPPLAGVRIQLLRDVLGYGARTIDGLRAGGAIG